MLVFFHSEQVFFVEFSDKKWVFAPIVCILPIQMGKNTIERAVKRLYLFATKLLKGSVIFVMKNLTKQAVILDNLSSPYICQAILILKGQPDCRQEKIIAEAEEIVAKYFNHEEYKPIHGKSKSNTWLKTAVALLCGALTASVFMMLLR